MTDYQPEALYRGGSTDPSGKLCIMNVVDRRWKLAHGLPLDALTDMPECTDPVVARVAQVVNDRMPRSSDGRLSASASARLLAREARIMSAVRLSTRGQVRLAWILASKVATTPEALAALDLVRCWLDGEDDLQDAADAYAAAAHAVYAVNAAAAHAAHAAHAAYAVYAAAAYAADAAAANAAAYAADAAAAHAAYAVYAADGDEDALIAWLDDVLDAHEKCVAEEGLGSEMAERAAEVARIHEADPR